MKLSRKNVGRIATTFLATAMLASLTAVPAMAVDDPTGVTRDTTFNIQKHLQVDDESFTPAKTFTFTVSPATPQSYKLTDAEIAKGVEYGRPNSVTASGTAEVKANAATTNGEVVVPSTDFTVDLNQFDHAGIYKYYVTETKDGDENFNYDDNTLILYVHIKNDKDAENKDIIALDYVELIDSDYDIANVNGEGKKDGFTNEYGVDEEDHDKLHNITLTKVVDGDGANMNGTFGFKVKVDSEYDNSKYLVFDINNNGKLDKEDQWTKLEDGVESAEFYLGNGDYAFIVGLTDGDSYTINECEPGNGYTTTAAYGPEQEDQIEFDQGLQFTDTGLTQDKTVTYTNVRMTVTPTGIVTNVAPYALLVVIAAAGCFVFLRKRDED